MKREGIAQGEVSAITKQEFVNAFLDSVALFVTDR